MVPSSKLKLKMHSILCIFEFNNNSMGLGSFLHPFILGQNVTRSGERWDAAPYFLKLGA